MTILVTGGAGFIGSNFILDWFSRTDEPVINLDKLTYAGNAANLAPLLKDPKYTFVRGDICDRGLVANLLAQYQPRAVLNFAAESHVDRSIHSPAAFLKTNIEGTFSLLEAARDYWGGLEVSSKAVFRFHHVSTDEVYGSLGPAEQPFAESRAYEPNSPYAASKAASDHLVRAWHRTYGMPVLMTNCSNNYGPFQFPEKLIPLVITNALALRELPIYGDGLNVRDWIYVSDHCAAIMAVLERGEIGETYNIGGQSERTNIEVVELICDVLDELRPDSVGGYRRFITYVADRPGHDRRYSVDVTKIRAALGWTAGETFESGIRKTVAWYLENEQWTTQVQTGAYRDWITRNYETRRHE